MPKESFREELLRGPMIFDGGMGTYFSSAEKRPGKGCEMANLEKPILVSAIHQEYLEAGARAIKTNTFASNRVAYPGGNHVVKRQIRAGYQLAKKVADRYDAHVFADIGPISELDEEGTREEYRYIIDAFLEEGAENFLFETNASMEGLQESAEYIRSRCPEAYIIVSYAVLPGGYTRDGLFGEDLLRETMALETADAVGFNCISGVRQLEELLSEMNLNGIPLSIMPNSGSPVVENHRTIYQSDPEYFGKELAKLAGQGVSILGGCCGTTPKHIACLKEALEHVIPSAEISNDRIRKRLEAKESSFTQKLKLGLKPIAVEFDPPKYENIHSYIEDARRIQESGAEIITIADCPTARATMDSCMVAGMLKHAGVEALPHMTCRDRNLNAAQALLLGLSAIDVQNILIVTGDPIPTAERDEVKSVYQFNSRKMSHFIRGLARKGTIQPFHIFGALNVNALNFNAELGRAKKKIEQGMQGFLTQPVLTERGLMNLRRAKTELPSYILGGIMPVISERNARFMNSEVNGIEVDEEIIRRYQSLERGAAENLAVRISTEVAREMAPCVDGFYVITPFNRTELVRRVVESIRGLSVNS